MVRRRRLSSALLVRALSLVVAAFCVFSQLAGAAHFLLVSHEVCLEHGELIHGRSHAVAKSERAASSAPEANAADSGDDDHGHDHCVLRSHKSAAAAVGRATRVAAARPLAPRLELAIPKARAAVVALRSRLLLIAPKSSPPARALV